MATVAQCFTELGVSKIRIAGGEPLIRRDIIKIVQRLDQLSLLDELTLTTNGSHLTQYAQQLHSAGVKRINISLDSLHARHFKELTRIGHLQTVLEGIETARQAGFERIKLICIVLKNRNADEVIELVNFALEKQLDISFIEEMPLGSISEHDRSEEFYSSEELRQRISQHQPLQSTQSHSAGPSLYWRTPGLDSRIGFISLMSNRVICRA